MCTLGPSSSNYEVLRKMVEASMDVAPITEKHRQDIDFGIENRVDFFAISLGIGPVIPASTNFLRVYQVE